MKPDLLSGLVWLGVSVFAIVEGLDLGLGSPSDPGSGALIFWAGLLMALLSVGVMADGLRQGTETVALARLWDGARWRKVVWIVAVLVAYGAAMLPIGFLVSTGVFLFVLFLSVEWTRPPIAAAMAIGSTLAVYVLFVRVLGVGLPPGILSF